MRVAGARFHVAWLDAWSLLIWLSGMVWCLGGKDLLRWCLPALVFLVLMLPLPWRIEQLFAVPLEKTSTSIAAALLVLTGQPALATDNVLLLEDRQVEVGEACSGLRLFMAIVALSYFLSMVFRQPLPLQLLQILVAFPAAVLANAVRVTVAGGILAIGLSDVAEEMIHDTAGWATIPLAAAILAMGAWWLRRAVVPVQRRATTDASPTFY
jgi:exosortase